MGTATSQQECLGNLEITMKDVWMVDSLLCDKYISGFKINGVVFKLLDQKKERTLRWIMWNILAAYNYIAPAFPTIVTSADLPYTTYCSIATGKICNLTILGRLENRTSFGSMTPAPLWPLVPLSFVREGVTFGFPFQNCRGNSRFSSFSACCLA